MVFTVTASLLTISNMAFSAAGGNIHATLGWFAAFCAIVMHECQRRLTHEGSGK